MNFASIRKKIQKTNNRPGTSDCCHIRDQSPECGLAPVTWSALCSSLPVLCPAGLFRHQPCSLWPQGLCLQPTLMPFWPSPPLPFVASLFTPWLSAPALLSRRALVWPAYGRLLYIYTTSDWVVSLGSGALHNFLVLNNHPVMLWDSIGQELRHAEDGLSLLCDVWSLSWEDLNSWGLESSGSISTHVSGAWIGVAQRRGSAGTVDQSSYSEFPRVA